MNRGSILTFVGEQNHSECNTDTIYKVWVYVSYGIVDSMYGCHIICHLFHKYKRKIYLEVTDSNGFPSRELENDHTPG